MVQTPDSLGLLGSLQDRRMSQKDAGEVMTDLDTTLIHSYRSTHIGSIVYVTSPPKRRHIALVVSIFPRVVGPVAKVFVQNPCKRTEVVARGTKAHSHADLSAASFRYMPKFHSCCHTQTNLDLMSS